MAGEDVVNTFERELYSAMSEGKPIKKYIKTILGKVYVTALDPFDGKPQPVELSGQPVASNPKAIIELWSTKEDMFFRKMNREHFTAGNLREIELSEPVKVEKSPNTISEAEIEDILNKPFLALKNKLNSFTDEAPVYRFLRKAEEMEKSVKIIDAIKARLSELTLGSAKEESESS